MTMPTSGFNVPRGSFPTPIAPIGVGPLDGPLVEARFNYKWCSVIVGCLSQLLLNTTWDVDTQEQLTAIQENVFDLMAAFCVNPPEAGITPNTGADGGDDFMLRQNPDNACELQTSVDGVHWCTWADLSLCVPLVGQQAGGSPQPTPSGGCQTYHVILPSNGKYLLPAPVNPGDTLEITNLQGASNDGTLAPWYCGDGNLYFAGGCFGSSTTQPSDPVNTSPHLQLIAEAGGLFFPVLGGVISVGAVGAFQNLTFQVNDSILADNSGSLEFDVKICNNAVSQFTHHFDFRLAPGPFTPDDQSGASNMAWTAGIGWQASTTSPVISGRGAILLIMNNAHSLAHCTLRMVGTCTDGSSDGQQLSQQTAAYPPLATGEEHHQFVSGAIDFAPTFAATLTRFWGVLQAGGTVGDTALWTDLYVTADGPDPF